jgi:hypothetical protein
VYPVFRHRRAACFPYGDDNTAALSVHGENLLRGYSALAVKNKAASAVAEAALLKRPREIG